jgi:hypothetical protein
MRSCSADAVMVVGKFTSVIYRIDANYGVAGGGIGGGDSGMLVAGATVSGTGEQFSVVVVAVTKP